MFKHIHKNEWEQVEKYCDSILMPPLVCVSTSQSRPTSSDLSSCYIYNVLYNT